MCRGCGPVLSNVYVHVVEVIYTGSWAFLEQFSSLGTYINTLKPQQRCHIRP